LMPEWICCLVPQRWLFFLNFMSYYFMVYQEVLCMKLHFEHVMKIITKIINSVVASSVPYIIVQYASFKSYCTLHCVFRVTLIIIRCLKTVGGNCCVSVLWFWCSMYSPIYVLMCFLGLNLDYKWHLFKVQRRPNVVWQRTKTISALHHGRASWESCFGGSPIECGKHRLQSWHFCGICAWRSANAESVLQVGATNYGRWPQGCTHGNLPGDVDTWW
jgi:hypothetical protein